MTLETPAPLPILIAPHPLLRARARRVGPDDADAVRDPAWENLLSRLSSEMRLSGRVELRIAQGPVAPLKEAAARPKRSAKPPPRPAEAEADLAASIASAPDDLRAALVRLGRVALSRSDIKSD